jgi:ribonuclease HI
MEGWIPNNIPNKIATLPTPTDANGKDERAGIGGTNMEYYVAAMYDQLCSYDIQDADPVWNSVWKLRVPERVRCFIWLLLHDRLLTNHRKNRMGIGHAMCSYCVNVVETNLHVLRDCILVAPFWLQVVPLEDRNIFFMEDYQQWIHLNVRKEVQRRNGGAWCDFWATACHSLWMWRNKETHDDGYVRPIHIVRQVRQRVDEYYQAQRTHEVMKHRESLVVHVGWLPPSGNFVKLNTDGARKDHGSAGCGGIIRGSHGEWLGGFAKGVGTCSAFVAELWGVFEGLKFAKRLGFMAIELNIDSSVVVQVIKTGRLNSSVGMTLVRNIQRLVNMEWEVRIVHAYRESNQCADALANVGCTLDREIIFYDDCPPHIRNLLRYDVMGITTPRLISV